MPKALAAATVDRLLQHAHVIVTDGMDSYRLAQAIEGKGWRRWADARARDRISFASAYGLRFADANQELERGEAWPRVGR